MDRENNKSIPLLVLLYKNLVLEILIVILCALAMFGYSIYTNKTYYTVSQSVMLRTSITSALGNASQSSNASHGKLYMPMIKDSITNPEAIKKANDMYKQKYPQATDGIDSSAIKVGYKDDSLIFNVSYMDRDEAVSKAKLAIIFEVANQQLKNDIKGDVKLILTDGVDEDGAVRYYSIVTSDSTLQNTILGVFIGIAVAVAVVLLRYLTNKTITDKDEFEKMTGVSVLTFLE